MSRLCLPTSFKASSINGVCIENYWKILGNMKSKEYVSPMLFPNGYLAMFNKTDSKIDVFSGKSVVPVLKDISLFKVFPSGYVILGKTTDVLGLYSPKGKLLAKFVYDNGIKSGCIQKDLRNEVPVYTSSMRFFNQFTSQLKNNTIAVIDGGVVYLTTVDKLSDVDKLLFIGKENIVSSISDSYNGMIAVKFVDGQTLLINRKLEYVDIGHKIIGINFLENGDFIARTIKNKILLFDKNAKFIKELQKKTEVVDGERCYYCDGKCFDCYSHEEVNKNNLPIIFNKAKGIEVFYDEAIYNQKKMNNGEVYTSYVVSLIPKDFLVTDRRLISFKYKEKFFVFDGFSNHDEILSNVYNVINDVDQSKDLSLEMFDYLTTLLECSLYSSHTLKGMLKRLISTLSCNKLLY